MTLRGQRQLMNLNIGEESEEGIWTGLNFGKKSVDSGLDP